MNSGPIQPMRCGLNQIGEFCACAVQTGNRQEFRLEVKRFGFTFSKINNSRPDPIFRTLDLTFSRINISRPDPMFRTAPCKRVTARTYCLT
jgi:hypothetical protein